MHGRNRCEDSLGGEGGLAKVERKIALWIIRASMTRRGCEGCVSRM